MVLSPFFWGRTFFISGMKKAPVNADRGFFLNLSLRERTPAMKNLELHKNIKRALLSLCAVKPKSNDLRRLHAQSLLIGSNKASFQAMGVELPAQANLESRIKFVKRWVTNKWTGYQLHFLALDLAQMACKYYKKRFKTVLLNPNFTIDPTKPMELLNSTCK